MGQEMPAVPPAPPARRRWRWLAVLGIAAAFAAAIAGKYYYPFVSDGPLVREAIVFVEAGTSVAAAGRLLEKQGIISSGNTFHRMARFFGSKKSIKPGEYKIPAHSSMRAILEQLQSGNVLMRRVTVVEGMSAVQIYERLKAEDKLTGDISIPAEGSVLPDTYSFARGTKREAIIAQGQTAMAKFIAATWAKRAVDLPLKTPEEAVVLASIIEKETSKKDELAKVAGVYINRLEQGMKLQADPTIIYPVTKGKPLGRRILRSEIDAINDYNTYTREGLPVGPIAMPGRKAIEAAMNPEKTDALFFVADGSGGHVFAKSNADHARNVANWKKFRAQKGI